MQSNTPVLESISMLDESTVEVKYRENVKVGLNEIKDIFNNLYDYTANKRVKRLIVISKDSYMEMPARIFLREENKSKRENIIAEAVVVTSLTQKMAINFYLKFIKDTFPCKFFTDLNKAKEWLKSQT